VAQNPIVIAYHLIWTGYGWWLPNDPRGSMSTTIRNDVLGDLGALHRGRKVVQPASREIREFYREARNRLEYPLRSFAEDEPQTIAVAFGEVIARERYTCYACAIMPDHVHVLIRKHKHQAEEMIANLQDASRLRLRESSSFLAEHPVWGGKGWKVFLDHPDDVRRTIKYVEGNPIHAHLPSQQWAFVAPYDGWPLHPGHSPNSPYVRRLQQNGREV
jgi:REP element-mobilizing transposase RayT